MKTFLALAFGVVLGFVAAHQFNRTEQGQRFFHDLDAKAREFGAAVADGYHAREAELRSPED
ncbi:hypothetical protein GCM10022288_27170 [Gryllotalpicola kribbensis]|jgi:hypothetical protein|uniref:YtxH domain-containing protein n=1 Tax=Gryllotalpicola kribbensis TaxID=993084 RepID=A0ABP8AY45_9MICO